MLNEGFWRGRRQRGAGRELRRKLTSFARKRVEARDRGRQAPVTADAPERGATRDPRRGAGAQDCSVYSEAVADPSSARAPIAERNPQNARGKAVREPDGPAEPPPLRDDLDLVALANVEAARVRGGHLDRIAPDSLRERLWAFLQPRIVGEAPIENGRIRRVDERESRGLSGRGPVRKRRPWRAHRLGRLILIDDAVDQRLRPARLEAVRAPSPAPCCAEAFVIALVRLSGHRCEGSRVRSHEGHNGRINGCTRLTAPSGEAMSLHDSSGWGAGACQVEAAAVSSK